MQLVRKRNSLTIVVILYLQVFTSPFHKYYQRCTDCHTIYGTTTTIRSDDKSKRFNTRETHATKVDETIIVNDDDIATVSFYNQNNATYCDKLSESLFHNRSMVCIDYSYCPVILSKPEATVRQLSCGINIDGSIKVCCTESDRSGLSLSPLPSDSDNGSIITGYNDSFYNDTLNHQDESTTRQSTGEPLEARENGTAGETVIVTDDDHRATIGKSTEDRDKNHHNASDLLAKELNLNIGKFPTECGKVHDRENLDETRIIGGTSARRNAWPWYALLMIRRRNQRRDPECGGTLISNRFVLTAAHCVLKQAKQATIRASSVTVRLGEHDLKLTGDGEIDVGVERIIVHPNFQPKTFKNDIALIKLDRKIVFNDTIEPACLPYDNLKLANQTPGAVDNETVWVLGFGQTSYNGRTSDHLRQADLRIVQHSRCRQAFGHLVKLTREYVCASSQYDDDSDRRLASKSTPPNGTSGKLKDSCQGDSGGPLMMLSWSSSSSSSSSSEAKNKSKRWYIYGIVSFGYRCASAGFPGVYTRVNRYLSWIESSMD